MLRVAAYCRVSSELDEQTNSIASQIDYYTRFISQNSEWICAGVFADRGSGRNTKKRPVFVELMRLCQKKKVNLILTKSISRFGRNTLESLRALRKLKELEIDVWFEIEDIRLLDAKGWFALEVFCAFAQSESESRSEDIKSGLRRSFRNPNNKKNHRVCYGYTHDAHGRLIINEPEAEIIRLIFQLRVDGYSLRKISDELARREVPSPTGKMKWSAATLDKLLANEKYIGEVVQQKTFVEDFFSGAQAKNIRQIERSRIVNHHEGIVGKGIWDRIQTI